MLQAVWCRRSHFQATAIRIGWSASLMAVVGAVALLSNQAAPEIVYKAF
jgi:hypothetical protein